MVQYILFTLHRQGSRSLLAAGCFLLAACMLVLLSTTTQTTIVQANRIINQNWRPTYDLVVLPPQTQFSSGKPVPSDQFEGYNGGISFQQYEQITHLPGVAIAAPIAFLGYAQYPNFTVQLDSPHLLPGFYQVAWTMTAFDGRQHLVELQHTVRIYVPTTSCSTICTFGLTPDLINLGVTETSPKNSGYLSSAPSVGSFLLAAIDPAAENALVHLDKSVVSGRMLTEQDSPYLDPVQPRLPPAIVGNASHYDVPMLLNIQRSSEVTLHLSLMRLASDTIDPQQILVRGGSIYLDRLPRQSLFSEDVPTAYNDLHLFSQGILVTWQGHSWRIRTISQLATFFLNFTSTPSSLSYQSQHTPSQASGPTYTLVPKGTQGPEVAFHDLTPLGRDNESTYAYPIYHGSAYSTRVVGQFDGSKITAEFSNPLNWLPENTYTAPPEIAAYDAQGHPITPTLLLPTTNPAGFVLQPPLAFTTLAAARQLRGDDSISVIRIRVVGTITPDDTGWKRVTQVAQEIQQRTGLRVLVTLGSSPSPTLVYVPGLKQGQFGATHNIEPLGWVEERWIALGAGIVYLNQLGEMRLLLLTTVLLVCLGYLAISLSSQVSSQRRELALLSALGWRPWQPAGTFLMQTLFLSFSGGILGIGLALFIVVLIGASPPWLIVTWTLPIVLALALVSALYPLWHIWRIQPAEALRAGSSVTTEGSSRFARWNASLWALVPAVVGLAWRNLTRSRLRTVIALLSLFLSAILLTVMIDSLLAFRQSLQGTLLGDYVLLQTAVPQLAGAMFAVLLTFLNVADLLLLQVRERQKEIGLLLAVGWRPQTVQRLFVQEGLTLALGGTVPGVSVALWVLLARHAAQGRIPAPLVGAGAVIFMLLVAGLATLPAVRAINRLPVMEVLRAE